MVAFGDFGWDIEPEFWPDGSLVEGANPWLQCLATDIESLATVESLSHLPKIIGGKLQRLLDWDHIRSEFCDADFKVIRLHFLCSSMAPPGWDGDGRTKIDSTPCDVVFPFKCGVDTEAGECGACETQSFDCAYRQGPAVTER